MASLTFQALPFDVHFEVAKHLDYKSILKFAATNRYFHENISPHTVLLRQDQVEFLQAADLYKRNAALWACFFCHRMLPRDSYGDKMRKAKSGRQGLRLTSTAARHCWDCALQTRFYGHLEPVKKGSVCYYPCHQCGRPGTKSRKCQADYVSENGEMKKVTVCLTSQEIPERTYTALELLPTKVLESIVQHLDYRDTLRLAATTWKMRNTVKPHAWVPLHKRYRFVRRKWERYNGLSPDSPPQDNISKYADVPCYGCFRIKPTTRFTQMQLDFSDDRPEEDWKRRCHACVQNMFVTPDNDLLREWRRRRACGACKSLRYKDETCQGCVERLVAGEIDEIPVEATPDYKEYLEGVAELFSDLQSGGSMMKARWIPDPGEYVRLEKFQRRFWHGDMTTAERSLYTRISGRIHDRRREHGVFFSSLTRRFPCFTHRDGSDLSEGGVGA